MSPMSELNIQKLLDEPEGGNGNDSDPQIIADTSRVPFVTGANTDLNTLGEVAKKDADAFDLPMNGGVLELRESSHRDSLP